MTATARAFSALLFTALVLVATPGCASHYGWQGYPPDPAPRVDAHAFDRGYRDGYDDGVRDARKRRHYDYARHGDYRRADRGYRGYGHPGVYRRAYRDGFVSGYDDGYRQYARLGRGRGRSDYPSPRREGRYGYPGDARGPRSGFRSPAADNGYRDGYAQGRDDARDRDRYDPVRARRYRSGDSGYDTRYGSRDDYKREYRAAFQQGYEQGYRDAQR
jgi:hypothetical protein